jgi:hypothetical protein
MDSICSKLALVGALFYLNYREIICPFISNKPIDMEIISWSCTFQSFASCGLDLLTRLLSSSRI